MAKEKTYAGRIKNSGQQRVEAIFPSEKVKNGQVHRKTGESKGKGKK